MWWVRRGGVQWVAFRLGFGMACNWSPGTMKRNDVLLVRDTLDGCGFWWVFAGMLWLCPYVICTYISSAYFVSSGLLNTVFCFDIQFHVLTS